MLKILFHNDSMQYVKYLIHTFCVHVFFVLCWWCCHLNWHLIVLWFMISTGSMLVLLDEVTSTVNSCQLLWGYMLPGISMSIICMPCVGVQPFICLHHSMKLLSLTDIFLCLVSCLSLDVYKLYPFCKFGISILIPNSIP